MVKLRRSATIRRVAADRLVAMTMLALDRNYATK
jgi:hypothetical protein